METLVIGLLFVIGCLSLLICSLIRIIVELINGSNRKHNKSHVAIMCAALCGDYKNIDGDYYHSRGGGEHVHHHYQQQQDLRQPPQTHFNQRPTSQKKNSNKPIADDLRITFSDVRMTEYQTPDSAMEEGLGTMNRDRDADRITFSDVRMTEGGDMLPAPMSHQKDGSPDDGTIELSSGPEVVAGSGSGSGSGSDHQDTVARRNSAVYFKVPSFVRPASTGRRRSHTMGMTGNSGTKLGSDGDHDNDNGNDETTERHKLLDSKAEADQDRVTDRDRERRESDYSLDIGGVETVDLDALDSTGLDSVLQTDVYDIGAPSTNSTGISTVAAAQHRGEARLMRDPRFSEGSERDSILEECEQHEEEILRLQLEIAAMEGRSVTSPDGDNDSSLKHESDSSRVARLKAEMTELDSNTDEGGGGGGGGGTWRHHTFNQHRYFDDDDEFDINASGQGLPKMSQQQRGGDVQVKHDESSGGTEYVVDKGRYQNADDDNRDDNREKVMETTAASSNSSSFFKNPFSRQKKSSSPSSSPSNSNSVPSSSSSSHKLTTEGAYLAGTSGDVEQWPSSQHIVHKKKSSLTGSGGSGKPKRKVSFQFAIDEPPASSHSHRSPAYTPPPPSSSSGLGIKNVRPLADHSSDKDSSAASTGRKTVVSANSRAGRKAAANSNSHRTHSKSPPRPPQSGEAAWNSQQGRDRGNSLKVSKGVTVPLKPPDPSLTGTQGASPSSKGGGGGYFLEKR